jgi:7,8-dihydroneopterin aldolase/epimerase/oxygenase
VLTVELRGLEIFGRHGVGEQERRDGRTFLYDVELGVGEAGLTDRIEDAVDYRLVAARIKAVSDERRFNLLEALASAVADDLMAHFPLERVRVRVRKRDVAPAGLAVEYSAATAERGQA